MKNIVWYFPNILQAYINKQQIPDAKVKNNMEIKQTIIIMIIGVVVIGMSSSIVSAEESMRRISEEASEIPDNLVICPNPEEYDPETGEKLVHILEDADLDEEPSVIAPNLDITVDGDNDKNAVIGIDTSDENTEKILEKSSIPVIAAIGMIIVLVITLIAVKKKK